MNEKFNENLRKARIEKKLTQQQVANLIRNLLCTLSGSKYIEPSGAGRIIPDTKKPRKMQNSC